LPFSCHIACASTPKTTKPPHPEASTVIDLKLPSGTPAAIRAVAVGGAQDVARLPSADFNTATDTIKEIGTVLRLQGLGLNRDTRCRSSKQKLMFCGSF
jgi:hypothetical protein